MARGWLCKAASVPVIAFLAYQVYPMLLYPVEVSWRSRMTTPIARAVDPTPGSLASFIAFITGKSPYKVSRLMLASIGRGAELDSVKFTDTAIAEVRVRVYRPVSVADDRRLPVMVYYHGGGFFTGNLDSHHPFCLRLCEELEHVIVSVDYRMAPEFQHPAGFNDCMAVTAAIASSDGSDLNINPTAISVGGDSAGGNMAAAVALAWRETNHAPLRSQVLIYPVLQMLTFNSPSYLETDPSQGMNSDTIAFAYSLYLFGHPHFKNELLSNSTMLLPTETWQDVHRRISGEDIEIFPPVEAEYPHSKMLLSPTSSPLLAKTTKGVAPTIIILAHFDPLRSEGEHYARRLQHDGVDVILDVYRWQTHAFAAGPSMPAKSFFLWLLSNPDADSAIKKIVEFVRRFNP